MAKAGTSKAAAAERRQKFIEAYCGKHRGNATKSAIVAGFSAKTAYSQGHRLLKDVEVAAAIKRRLAKALKHASKATDLTAVEVMRDLAEAMRFDPAELYDENGHLRPVREMPPELRRHLEGVEVETRRERAAKGEDAVEVTTAKVRYAKKSVTRDQAMKHFGLYEKDNLQKPELPPIRIRFV